MWGMETTHFCEQFWQPRGITATMDSDSTTRSHTTPNSGGLERGTSGAVARLLQCQVVPFYTGACTPSATIRLTSAFDTGSMAKASLR